MNKQTIFRILEIEETRSETAIREAYRKKLAVTNPEDDPQGFMKLREAYEEALKWIRQEENVKEDVKEESEQARYLYYKEEELSIPVKEWIDKVKDVYTSIKKRFDIQQWKILLEDDIIQDLEYGQEAQQTLFLYLASYFRLNSKTYQLLDTYFHISDHADNYKEFLPEGFVGYMLNKIQDKKGESDFAYEWFEGDEYAPYDEYLEGQEYLEKQVDEENIEEARDCLDTLKDFGIYHPFTVLEEARLYVMTDKKEKALELVSALIEEYPKKYPDSLRIPYVVGEIYWKCDKKQQAMELFNMLVKEKDDIFSKKYIALNKWEEGDLLGASKAGVQYLSHVQDNEFDSVLSQIQQEAFDHHYKVEEMDKETALELLKCCYGLGKFDDGLALLKKNNQLPAYKNYFYQYLFYFGKKQFPKALEAAISYNVELQKGGEEEQKDIPMAYYYEAEANYNIAKSMDKARYATRQQRQKGVVYDNSFLEHAEEAILRAIQREPDKIMYKQFYFNILMEMKKYHEAYQCVDSILESYPNWFAAIAEKQEVCFKINKAQEVIDLYYRAKEIYAKFPQIYERAAQIFNQYKQLGDLKMILDEAKEEEVTSPMLELLELRYLHETHSGNTMDVYNKAKELEKRFKEQEEQPNREVFSSLYELLSRISHWLTKYKEARNYAKLAIKWLPDAENYYIYGWMLSFANQSDKAVVELEYAKSICDDEYLKVDIMYRLGWCYYERMEEEYSDYYAKKLIDVSTMTIQYDYKLDACYANRCYGYIALEEYNKAIDDVKEILKINHKSEEAHFAMAKIYYHLKSYDKAYYYAQKISSKRYDYEEKPRYNLLRARICEAKKDYEKAEKYYLAGLKYYNKDYSSADIFMNALIRLYKKMKLFGKAKEIMRNKDYNSLSYYEWEVLKLDYNYDLCDKKGLKKKIKKLLSKWETYINGALHKKKYCMDMLCIADVYYYYLDDVQHANKFYEMYEIYTDDSVISGSFKHLMYIYLIQGNKEGAKRCAKLFMKGLQKKYEFNPSQSAEEQYVNSVYVRKKNLFDMAVYWLCYDNIEKAREYCNRMKICDFCNNCMMEACTDYYELVGLLYEIEGDTKKALDYYKKAAQADKDNYVVRWKVEKGKATS